MPTNHGNPPFSHEKREHDAHKMQPDRFGRFRRGLPPKTKGDYAFILHMIKTSRGGPRPTARRHRG